MPAKSMFARRVFRQTSATPSANTCDKLTLRRTHLTTALMEPCSLLHELLLKCIAVAYRYNFIVLSVMCINLDNFTQSSI